MAKKTLTAVAETIHELEKQQTAKREALESVKKEIEAMYREGILRGQVDEVLRKTLEEKNMQLPHELSALAGMIEEAKEEVLDLARAEIEKIPEQIAALQASLLKKRESILSEFMKAVERVSFLHWRLNGARARIPWAGISNLVLPSLPQEAVIESNERLDILFRGQPKEDDSYAVELKLKALRDIQDKGPQKLASETIASVR